MAEGLVCLIDPLDWVGVSFLNVDVDDCEAIFSLSFFAASEAREKEDLVFCLFGTEDVLPELLPVVAGVSLDFVVLGDSYF